MGNICYAEREAPCDGPQGTKSALAVNNFGQAQNKLILIKHLYDDCISEWSDEILDYQSKAVLLKYRDASEIEF
jgi:hypothetical protein